VRVNRFEIMYLDVLSERPLCGQTDSGLRALRTKSAKSFGMMVARDGIETPTPAFSSQKNVFLTT